MRKKLLSILALLCLTVSSTWATVVASGNCGTTDHESEVIWSLDDAGVMTISGTGAMADYGYYDDLPWSSYVEGVQNIVIGSGVTGIGKRAFAGCAGLTTLTFENGSQLKSIGEGAFAYCSHLTSVTIPASVTTINSGAFSTCEELETITFAAGSQLVSIGNHAFESCYDEKLTAITIPASVTTIGDYTFVGCAGLQTVTFADESHLESIGECAFSGCEALTAISLPANVTAIGEEAFSGCDALMAINVDANNTSYVSEDGVLFNKLKTQLLQCPGKKSGVYDIPNSVTSIANRAFSGCSALTSVTIPSNVESIGEYAFFGCSNLTSINIPNKVTTISSGTFQECSSLTSIAIPNKVETIGNKAFNRCTGLTSLNLPASLESIGNYAFEYCTGLTTINLPAGVTSIGDYAFNDCTGLTSLTIPASLGTLNNNVFCNCSGLTTVTIGSGVTSINWAAFYHCTNVTHVYCYADLANLTWNTNIGDPFKTDGSTVCHVANGSDWSGLTHVNVTFQGDLAPTAATSSVSGAYWSTYYNSAANMKADANTTVYKASIDGTTVELTEISDKVINAGQAVVLKRSTEGAVALTPQTAASTADYSDNILHGVDARIATSAIKATLGDGTFYVLGDKNSHFGFHKYTADYMPANKAFLLINGGAALARDFFGFDETTAIERVSNGLELKANSLIFDLQGRKVANPTKGLYIVNGKKVIVK